MITHGRLVGMTFVFDKPGFVEKLEAFFERPDVAADMENVQDDTLPHNATIFQRALPEKTEKASLANAFEKSVEAKRGCGFVEPSIAALKKEWTDLKAAFGIDGVYPGLKYLYMGGEQLIAFPLPETSRLAICWNPENPNYHVRTLFSAISEGLGL